MSKNKLVPYVSSEWEKQETIHQEDNFFIFTFKAYIMHKRSLNLRHRCMFIRGQDMQRPEYNCESLPSDFNNTTELANWTIGGRQFQIAENVILQLSLA